METKDIRNIAFKADGPAGIFEGMLSPYGIKDSVNDIVMPGSYTKTLQERGTTVPLLFSHDPLRPIGQATLTDTPKGLMAKGSLLMELRDAQEAYILLKSGVMKGLSIGFQALKKEFKDGVRYLFEIKLFEASACMFPAAEGALITSVKSGLTPGLSRERELDILGKRMLSRIEDVQRLLRKEQSRRR